MTIAGKLQDIADLLTRAREAFDSTDMEKLEHLSGFDAFYDGYQGAKDAVLGLLRFAEEHDL